MAAIHRSSAQLFHELKTRYPEVPDEVVTTCIQQNGNDKEKCLQALQSDSPKYLFGSRLPVGQLNNDQLARRIQEVHITHEESASRPSYPQQFVRNREPDFHTSMSWPSNLADSANVDPGRQSPTTAPVMPQDFAPFVQPNTSKAPHQIPNIKCTTYAGTDSSGNASPQSTGSPGEGRRAVKVYHYPPRSPPTQPVSSVAPIGSISIPSQQQYVYRIQFGSDSGGMCTVSPQSSSVQHQSLPVAVNQQGQYSPELAGPQSMAGAPSQVSQKTFFINSNNTNNGQAMPERPGNVRTSNYNSQFSHDSRVGLHPAPANTTVHTSQVPGYGGVNQFPPGYNKQLSVTIRASGPEGAETKVRYFPSTPERPVPAYHMSGSVSPTVYGVNAVSSSSSQFPSQYSQSSFPNQSPLALNTSSAYITPVLPRFSPVAPSLATHGIPVQGSQSSSEHGNLILQETETGRRMPTSYPTMSPASSQSSLSSESSRDTQRQRSGSVQEEMAYTQALLSHQQARMERLKHDYDQECQKLDTLRAEVSQMEKNMLERRNLRRNSFPGVDDITKMREANRKLQTDIQVMMNEVDMYKNGQTPFSVIDPHGQQNFFKNIPTGQRNSIYSSRPANQPGSSESPPPPPVPPRENLVCVPPAPPAQPPANSGDSEEGEQWSCSACTFLNHPALNKCECCEMPRVAKGS